MEKALGFGNVRAALLGVVHGKRLENDFGFGAEGVGLYHVAARNHAGAKSLLERGIDGLAPFLPAREGLLLPDCNSIHTCFMRFPIDVLYLDREHTVVKAVRALRPFRFSACLRSGGHSVLELPIGAIEASGTQPGDSLALTGSLEHFSSYCRADSEPRPSGSGPTRLRSWLGIGLTCAEPRSTPTGEML